MQPSYEGSGIRCRGRGKIGLLESGKNELVDGIKAFCRVWNWGSDRRRISPMILPFCSLLNPFLDGVDLRRLEGFWKLLRGHAFLGIAMSYSEKQFALRRVSCHQQNRLAFTEQILLPIQPQLGFSLFFIRPVTGEAMVGQYRSYVAVELHFLGVGVEDHGDQ